MTPSPTTKPHGRFIAKLDSQLDSYKRGAFLEKADRFSEEKPSEVPGVYSTFVATYIWTRFPLGPGTYDTNPMIATKPTTKQSIADANARIAALQRKLEDLDKIHADGKKSVSGLNIRLYIEC